MLAILKLMKKFLLAGFVLLSFVIYSLHGRQDAGHGIISMNTKKPTNTTTKPTQTSSGNDTSNNTASPTPTQSTTSTYKDGTYTGDMENAFYGYVQVQAVVSGGKITDVVFLQHPSDRSESEYINSQAMPMLKQEAIQAQSANVDGVSGATDTSQAFVQSLEVALQKAVNA